MSIIDPPGAAIPDGVPKCRSASIKVWQSPARHLCEFCNKIASLGILCAS